MKGIHKLRVSNKNTDFRFELRRNITIVRGNSGTGKTTLYNMISEHARLGDASGINLSCDKTCIALTDTDWKHQLNTISDSIVFVDEGDKFVYSHDFAEIIKATDNYYVLLIRENLHELPYSVNEVYEIRTSGKYHTFKNLYRSKPGYIYAGNSKSIKYFEKIVTEDSKSGFRFFEKYFETSEVKCYTSSGNSNIYRWILEHIDQKIFVVADGAAFGSEMNRVMELQKRFPAQITICLPESFEWMILKSGIIPSKDLEAILDHTSNYVESSEYFSWERFFYSYLLRVTDKTHMKYSKEVLGDYYILENNAKKISAVIGL